VAAPTRKKRKRTFAEKKLSVVTLALEETINREWRTKRTKEVHAYKQRLGSFIVHHEFGAKIGVLAGFAMAVAVDARPQQFARGCALVLLEALCDLTRARICSYHGIDVSPSLVSRRGKNPTLYCMIAFTAGAITRIGVTMGMYFVAQHKYY